ncbi:MULTISPECIES: hypothetical protein [unclassified Streptomyces]|nr:hypothetical protein OG217_34175 [Streptomyces sp. NBC_01023]
MTRDLRILFQAPEGGDPVLGQGLGTVRRRRPRLDADRRIAEMYE